MLIYVNCSWLIGSVDDGFDVVGYGGVGTKERGGSGLFVGTEEQVGSGLVVGARFIYYY